MKDHEKSGVEPCRSAETVGKAGDDGQGALVERLRSPLAISGEHRAEAADRIEALTRENAALRADKERLERERGRYRGGLQVLATTFYKGDEHQDYAKHVLGNDAAERRLAEQGQAQGGEVVGLVAGGGDRAALAAPVSQEPVAWRWLAYDGWRMCEHEAEADRLRDKGLEVRPLYASPQPLTEGEPSEAEVEAARQIILDDVGVWLSSDTLRAALLAAKSKGGQADG